MTPHDEIKQKLRIAAILAQKQITEVQLEQATQRLEKQASVKKSDIETIGESVVGDRHIFASTDLDDINNLLGRLGQK